MTKGDKTLYKYYAQAIGVLALGETESSQEQGMVIYFLVINAI